MACNTKKQIIFPEPLGGEEEIYTYCLVDSGQEAQEHKVISLHSAKKFILLNTVVQFPRADVFHCRIKVLRRKQFK